MGTSSLITPDFFIIGAQKAATTTFHDLLSRESGICLPNEKETHYFSRTDKYNQGLNWYLNQFPKHRTSSTLMGEVDPDYSYFEESPKRISQDCNNPKLIMILRHPLSRAFSHYQMSKKRCAEKLGFIDALQEESRRAVNEDSFYFHKHHSYLARSDYPTLINRFKVHLPGSAWLFIDYHSLQAPGGLYTAYSEICSFLGHETILTSDDMVIASNRSSRPRSHVMNKFIHNKSPLKSMIGKCIPSKRIKGKMMRFADRANSDYATQANIQELNDIPRSIQNRSDDIIAETKIITGIDLSRLYEAHA
jgi:hypothetical protein